MPGSFFDSNVLIYSASADAAKVRRATDLLSSGGTVSVQVLGEVANVARRQMGYDWDRTFAFLATLRALVEIVDITLADHDVALEIARRYKLAIFDSVIVASALRHGCDCLWSEDMHDGLVINGRLTITNPFRN